MSHLGYDAVFYRVFCVTLLAVAFTFTIILTNVFVDIDGLLSNRNKYIPQTSSIPDSFLSDQESPIEAPNEISNEDREIEPSYRTKRSIESETTYRAKSPGVKMMLTRRLASLLEELDDEEPKKEETIETTTKTRVKEIEKNHSQGLRNEELLHLAMHNILLQGLIGHMDLNDVYKKVHVLMQTYNKSNKNEQDEKLNMLKSIVNSKEVLRDMPNLVKRNNYTEEHKFFDELIKCKELEKQIALTSLPNKINSTHENPTKRGNEDDKLFIKTIIEINEIDKRPKAPNITYPIENVEGLIKLVYNGKSIKINQIHDETSTQKISTSKAVHEINNNFVTNKNNEINAGPKTKVLNKTILKHEPSPLLNKILEQYLKMHSLPNYEYLQNSAEVKSIKTERSKRQIKIRYSDNVTSSKTPHVHEAVHKDDDDLYIEIETHFDGKGIKGEKKKKLVRNLIDKIQKALHSDIEQKRDSVEHIKFVKRTQDPIFSRNKIPLKKTRKKPLEPIEKRLLDPIVPNVMSIGKTLDTHDKVADQLGDRSWKKQNYGPNFLSTSKALNSAELNELNVEYDSILRNGIPKRLQAPLDTGAYDEDDSIGLLNPTSGNVTLLLKDIDGSGFSIGFNQYEGEPPDKDSMKMFNGIENLIREYHKTYDQNDNMNYESPKNKMDNYVTNHEMTKRNVENFHKVYRRSITEEGANYYNANNIFEIFFKDKPYLYNLVNRKKRSISVQQISNLKSKIKLNRYLNTKAMRNRKLFQKNKRNKRHVNNIRITARNRPQNKALLPNSDENIFFISKENSYADRETMIRAVDTKMNYKNNQYSDEESPFRDIYRIQTPNIQTRITEGIYNTAVRSNGLMAKYPHIFLDESSNSKEQINIVEKEPKANNKPYRIEASPQLAAAKREVGSTTEHTLVTLLQDFSVPKVEEMVGAMIPLTGNNYRITVKMSPKNKTNSSFKEVHTSVNKSYDDNGLRYYTLLNVSQISKVEKLNKTNKSQEIVQPLNYHLLDQQKLIKSLLKLHKNRVDQQLNSLLRESNNLEKVIESNKEYNIDKTLKLLTGDDNRMDNAHEEIDIDSVKQFQEYYNTESKQLTKAPTTAKPIAVIPSTTETIKIDKSTVVDTMKQNDNVTFEILRKIDKNTQILQTFLEKFSDKLDLDKNENTTNKPTEKSALEMKLDLFKDWKSYGLNSDAFFMPNELKNDSIPFVYAYQQSIPVNNNSLKQSLASVVYHGHMHANTMKNLNNENLKKPAPKMAPHVLVNTDNSKRKFNESRFFIDEINNFKLIPGKDRVISANIKINTTNNE